MKKLFILIFISISSLSYAGIVLPPQTIYVGDGTGACVLTSIQDAIDQAPPNSEIRVTREHTYFENLQIDKHLTIKGGYTNCGLAQLDSRLDSNRSTINAGGNGNAVEIIGAATTVHMSGFILTNGADEGNMIGDPAGGAVSILGDNSNVTFEQMQITGSSGFVGGGVYMGADSISLTLSHTLVDSNIANSGGGLYCAGNGQVFVNDSSGIVANMAAGVTGFDGFGGGIFTLQCTIQLRSGEGGQTGFHLVGVSSNIAENAGGGIYSESSNIYTNTYVGIVNIDHNTSDEGGGIYLGGNSSIHLAKMFFDSNTAHGNGGGLYMNNSTYVANTTVNSCILSGFPECNLFVNNLAEGIYGGAIYMENNSAATVNDHSIRARFIGNKANNGSAITALSGSVVNVQNSYFINNGDNANSGTGDNSTVRVSDTGSQANIYLSTFANNHTQDVFSAVDNAVVNLINSIVYDDIVGNDVALINEISGASFNYGCSIFHEGTTIGVIPPFNGSVVSTDPGFVDPANDNYSLRSDSSAIDRCSDAGIPVPIGMELDGDFRPMDVPNVTDGMGTYDAGADEFNNDLIFKNGFD